MDREKLIKNIEQQISEPTNEFVVLWFSEAEYVLELLKEQERTGSWKDNGNGTISCSECGTWFQKEREPYLCFCGWCGAKMGRSVK